MVSDVLNSSLQGQFRKGSVSGKGAFTSGQTGHLGSSQTQETFPTLLNWSDRQAQNDTV